MTRQQSSIARKKPEIVNIAASSGRDRNDVSPTYLKSIGLTQDVNSNANNIYKHTTARHLDTLGDFNDGYLAGGANSSNPLNQPKPPGGPGGGNNGYGYFSEMMKLINQKKRANVGAAPEDTLSPLVREAAARDAARSDEAWAGVAPLESNAYRDMAPVSVEARDPRIAGLLRSQGMDDGFAEAKRLESEQEMRDLASLWSGYGNAMTANTDRSNAARNADVMTMSANDKRQIESQEMALLAAAGQQFQSRQEAHANANVAADNQFNSELFELAARLLEQGLASGVDMSGFDIASLLGRSV